MRRQIIVEIDVADDIEGHTYFKDNVQGDINHYKICVRRDSGVTPTQHQSLFGLAHECGHMLGVIFGLPGMLNDPRSFCRSAVPVLDYGDAIPQSEREAWDNAELIISLAVQRREYLKTYQSLYNPDLFFDPRKFYREIE